MARLGDVGKVVTGNTPKTSDSQNYASNDICFIKPSDIADGIVTYLNNSEFYISEYARAKARVLPPKSVLVTCIGIIGKVAINHVECAFNQQINAIIPDMSKCLTEYLAYAIQNKQLEMQDIANAPVVPILNKTQFSDIEINLPSLTEQKEIVEKLNVVSRLIALRKEQLAKLDQLVKSRFIELFGDNNYPSEPLDNNVVEMFIGPFGSSLKNEVFVDEENGFCMVYEQKHAIQKTMNVPTRYVPKSKYEELKRFTILGGDIIVSCRGTIGEIFIVPDNAPMGIMHPSIMKIRLNTEKYNQKFFVFALEQYMDEHNAEAKGSGVKMAVSATVLGQSDFVVPPMEVQNQFAAFVEQTDKSKLAIQQSLDKLELLKKSLMQEYFG